MKNDLQLTMHGDGPRGAKARKSTVEKTKGTPPRRTTFDKDGLHVATIVEFVDDSRKGHGFCNWYTAADSGVAEDFASAERQIKEALLR